MPSLSLPPLPPVPSASQIGALVGELQRSVPALALLDGPADLEKLSGDFHTYSPVLRQLLAGFKGQVVACPTSVEEVMAVAGACARHGVPLTVRGAGTGNYGQCVPLSLIHI